MSTYSVPWSRFLCAGPHDKGRYRVGWIEKLETDFASPILGFCPNGRSPNIAFRWKYNVWSQLFVWHVLWTCYFFELSHRAFYVMKLRFQSFLKRDLCNKEMNVALFVCLLHGPFCVLPRDTILCSLGLHIGVSHFLCCFKVLRSPSKSLLINLQATIWTYEELVSREILNSKQKFLGGAVTKPLVLSAVQTIILFITVWNVTFFCYLETIDSNLNFVFWFQYLETNAMVRSWW